MISKSLIGVRKHVWSMDSALDKSDPDQFAAAWTAFLEGGEMAVLPLVEGCKPAEFDIAGLTRRQFLHVYNGSGGALENMAEAVAYGVRGVRGFQIDGKPIDFERVKSDSGQRLSVATLDALFDPLLFAELGSRILEISRIDPTRGQG